MKHFKVFSILAVPSLMLSAFAALSFNRQNFKKASATGNEVAISIADGGWNPIGWGSKGVSAAGLTSSVTANNQVNMWSSDFLNFAKHDTIEMEISFNGYDSTTANIGNSSDGLDIYIKSEDNNTTYGIFRIWSAAWGVTNGNHPVQMWTGDWNTSTSGDSSFPSEGGGETGNIQGNAVSTSSFKLRLSKEYGIEFWNVWDHWSHCNVEAITTPIKNAFNGNFTLVFGADGGFARDVTFTLKKYNGQSFANDGAVFIDNVAPEIKGAQSGSIAKYQPLSRNVVGWDVFDGDVAVSILDTSDDPLTYFDATGTQYAKYVAADSFGNKNEIVNEFTVGAATAESFAAWLLLDHSETCLNKYRTAKNIFRELSADEKTAFQEGDFASARARYENWCRANGDNAPYSGGEPVAAQTQIVIRNNSVAVIIAVLTSILVISVVGIYFTIRRRRFEK